MANKMVIANVYKAAILEGGRPFLNTLELRLGVVDVALSGTVLPESPDDECTDGGYAALANPYPTAAVASGTRADAIGVNPTVVFDHDDGDFTVYNVFFTDPANADATVMAQRVEIGSEFECTAAGQVFVVEVHFFFDTMTTV